MSLLVKKERRQFYSFIFFDVIISIADIASLALLLIIINFYSLAATDAGTLKMSNWFVDRQSIIPAVLFLTFFGVKNMFAYMHQKKQYRFVYGVAARLSKNKMTEYLEGNYESYSTIDSSVHIRAVSQQPVEFAQYILVSIQQIITQTVLIAAALIAVCWFNASLFILLFALLMPPVIVIALYLKKQTRAARTGARINGEKTIQYLNESLAGFIESNIYDKHHFFTTRYVAWQQKLNVHLSKIQGLQGLPGRLLEVFAVLGLFILIVVSRWASIEGTFNILTIGAFMAAAYKIMPGVVKILNCSGQIRTYSFTINNFKQTRTATKGGLKEEKENIRSIEFRKVSFAYGQQSLLNEFNLLATTGDFVGISGISGSGKTTLLNLLTAFLDPDHGDICINGVAINMVERKQWRKRIAYVKQQSFLIHDSIIKNITLDDDNFDQQRLEAVLTATGLEMLIKNDPAGLDKMITEAGRNISGGQRQRIIIARALYKNADLIILDEPFNELDNASEDLMLKHFSAMAAQGKIILLITHKKTSLLFCNKIISLDGK